MDVDLQWPTLIVPDEEAHGEGRGQIVDRDHCGRFLLRHCFSLLSTVSPPDDPLIAAQTCPIVSALCFNLRPTNSGMLSSTNNNPLLCLGGRLKRRAQVRDAGLAGHALS